MIIQAHIDLDAWCKLQRDDTLAHSSCMPW